ncbi:unnamed protein product [Sphenostylis stenocarpa]|uniref:Uncharacterized protein n=1 Tax=Sphenostylis stenocarpa TaxID=92480 RepID=A0AA86W594_9FABA|nr:unnamed protein product [Sphenostylis stenocarpa]
MGCLVETEYGSIGYLSLSLGDADEVHELTPVTVNAIVNAWCGNKPTNIDLDIGLYYIGYLCGVLGTTEMYLTHDGEVGFFWGIKVFTSRALGSFGDPYILQKETPSLVRHRKILASKTKKTRMGDISLRQWLDKPERPVNAFECLNIFRQIVEIVHVAHSQGNVVHNVRPSCFVISSFNHVSFMDPATSSYAGLDALEDVEIKTPTLTPSHDMHQQRCSGSEDVVLVKTPTVSLSDSSCLLSSLVFVASTSVMDDIEENKMKNRRKEEEVAGKKQLFPIKQELRMEASWYTSPEEVAGALCSRASDIYQLGVLLFEHQ